MVRAQSLEFHRRARFHRRRMENQQAEYGYQSGTGRQHESIGLVGRLPERLAGAERSSAIR